MPEPLVFTAVAKTDLSQHYFNIVAARPNGEVDVSSHAAAALTLGPVGVLYNKPAAQGRHASIAWSGKAKVRVGAAITRWAYFTSNGSGRAIDATSGQVVIGRFLSAASSDGEIADVLLVPAFRLTGI